MRRVLGLMYRRAVPFVAMEAPTALASNLFILSIAADRAQDAARHLCLLRELEEGERSFMDGYRQQEGVGLERSGLNRRLKLQRVVKVKTSLRSMAAASVTMAALTSIGAVGVPEIDNARTPRLSSTAFLPSIQFRSGPFISEFFGASWKSQSPTRVPFAQPSVSRSIATMAAKASVGLENEVLEPVTGIKFQRNTIAPGASKELVLAGAGVREKKIAFLKVKVYAVGLYVEPSVASSLEAWKAKAGSELEKDEGFCKALIGAPIEKSLRIVLARDIEGAQFWGALDEALAARLRASGAGAGGEKALAAFGDVFKGRPLKERTVIFLTWTQPSTLDISISEEGAPPSASDASIESEALLSCLFDVYLGKEPVSPTTKAAVIKGIFLVA